VIPRQMRPRLRHQSGKTGHKIHGLEDDMRRAGALGQVVGMPASAGESS
jgi:hypothetical protein